MKLFTTLLVLFATALPARAAAPRACRIANVSRASRVRVVATSHASNHHVANPELVITAFAVPVAVPVATFASYWYGVNDYHDTFSLRGPASRRTAHEAPPRETGHDAVGHEAVPQGSAFPGRASERERTIVVQKCTSCHGRTSPKQGLSLIDPLSLSAEDRLRSIRAVVSGEMPPAGSEPLNDVDRTAILRELTAE